MTKSLVLRAWPIRVDSSARPFVSASRRCSHSPMPAVGPQVDWQWATLTQVPGLSNHQARNWEFHLYDIFFQVGVLPGEFKTVRELSPNQIPSFWRAS